MTDSSTAQNLTIAAGPDATTSDLLAAGERERLVRSELTRVRTAAVAWRNALGAPFVALIGFGLVKGRSDVSLIDPVWAAAVGVLLLAAFGSGVIAALSLIRAANGRPRVVEVRDLLGHAGSIDHVEALLSAAALQRGIRLTVGCSVFVAAALGSTWYAPAARPPAIEFNTPSAGPVCGAVRPAGQGRVTVNTDSGTVTVLLAEVTSMRVVEVCPTK
ncbi:hypothetical protein [Streptomyces sp. NRRL B-24484]|uniref:hypothetical protein n=1 Tax=Streptomyces sp. NRRL B-24484 TaxID=1463833 RepID=UPI00069468DE|nr:hypothetical protein [Streptomyces sp. NRRL B-24484]